MRSLAQGEARSLVDFVQRNRRILWSADLARYDLSGIVLPAADLGMSDLTHTNLTRANLCCANLDHATLAHTDFTDANLVGTCLDPTNTIQPPSVRDLEIAGFDIRECAGGIQVWGVRTFMSAFIGCAEYHYGETYVAPLFSTSSAPCHPGIYICPNVRELVQMLTRGCPGSLALPTNKHGNSIVRCWSWHHNLHSASNKYRTRELHIWDRVSEEPHEHDGSCSVVGLCMDSRARRGPIRVTRATVR